MALRLELDPDGISTFCTRWKVAELAVFGSATRDDFRADSDLDVLIELEKPYRLDLLKFIELEQNLSDELGLKVDLMKDEVAVDLSKEDEAERAKTSPMTLGFQSSM